MTMEWVEPFYTKKSEWFGPSGILEHHEARAATIARLCGPAPRRVLELGAGAGGSAAAAANLGYDVVAVELSPLRAAYARELAGEPRAGQLSVVEGDFYAIDLPGRFDAVVYWNGFGIGDDEDQRRLLGRIADDWLAPGGTVLVDIFNPWPWARAAGQEDRDDDLKLIQRNDYDPLAGRFLDSWWPEGSPEQVITQSIRCYAPADLELLLATSPFAVDLLEVDEAAIDRDAPATIGSPLWEAWSYLVRLRPR